MIKYNNIILFSYMNSFYCKLTNKKNDIFYFQNFRKIKIVNYCSLGVYNLLQLKTRFPMHDLPVVTT